MFNKITDQQVIDILIKYEIPENRKSATVFNVQWFLRENIVKTPEEIEILTKWLRSQDSHN